MQNVMNNYNIEWSEVSSKKTIAIEVILYGGVEWFVLVA